METVALSTTSFISQTMPRGNDNLIVSVSEARKLLGESAKSLADEEIERMIILLDIIAKESIEQSRSKIVSNGRESKPKTPKSD